MGRTALVALLAVGLASTAWGQTAAKTPATLRLTVDEAVKMALEHNVDLGADRLDPQISDTRVAAASGAFRPSITSSVQSNNQLQPPSNLLFPTATRTTLVSTNAALSQRLPWFGASYSVSWTATHTNSNSFLNSFNPLLQSGASITVSQPLLRDLFIDGSRQQLATSRTNRDIADTRLRESLVHTTSGVKAAYWNLVSARANVEARRSTLDLAQELARVNKAKVDVGSLPPIDLMAAQAEVAANQEQLIIAETAVRQSEDRLRLLIFDLTDRSNWNAAHRADRLSAGRHGDRGRRPGRDPRARGARRPRAGAEGHRQLGDRRLVRRQSDAAGRPAERELPGERPRRHAGAAHRGLPRHDRRAGRRDRFRSGAQPADRSRLPHVGASASACRTRSGPASNRRTTRAPDSSGRRPPSALPARKPASFCRCATRRGRSR